MNAQRLSLQDLCKPDWYFKEDLDEAHLAKLANALVSAKSYGDIVCYQKEEKWIVIDGWQRVRALKQLGAKQVNVQYYDNLSDSDAFHVAWARNARWSDIDALVLARHFAELYLIEPSTLSHRLPHTELELESLKKLLEFDWSMFSPDNPDQLKLF